MNKQEIAQWVIDNRYPKNENDKISDFEMFCFIKDNISLTLRQQREICAEVVGKTWGKDYLVMHGTVMNCREPE